MLTEKHRAELHTSGITAELIEASGIRSISSREAYDILGWSAGPGSRDMAGYCIPFFANFKAAIIISPFCLFYYTMK